MGSFLIKSPIIVVLHRDDIVLFKSADVAESYLEPEYDRPEDAKEVFDSQGSLLRWRIADEPAFFGLGIRQVYRLEVASEEPKHALVLRADLLCYLAHNERFKRFDGSLFSLPLSSLIEKVVELNGFMR